MRFQTQHHGFIESTPFNYYINMRSKVAVDVRAAPDGLQFENLNDILTNFHDLNIQLVT